MNAFAGMMAGLLVAVGVAGCRQSTLPPSEHAIEPPIEASAPIRAPRDATEQKRAPLKAVDAVTPSRRAMIPPAVLEVDWRRIEDQLVERAEEQFAAVLNRYPDAAFYGVFFDADLFGAEVLGHMNTEELLREQAAAIQTRSSPPLFPGRSVAEVMDQLRWDGGSWLNSLYEGPDLATLEAAFKRLLESDEDAAEAFKEEFMNALCRAAIRMEKNGVFERFKAKRADFRILCVYRDESVENGNERLERVKASQND